MLHLLLHMDIVNYVPLSLIILELFEKQKLIYDQILHE